MGNKKKKEVVLTTALAYINKIAPTHSRNSCSPKEGEEKTERTRINAQYSAEDCGGCFRCTLMEVHNLTLENKPAPEEEEE